MRLLVDRPRPPYRDDPLISRLNDEQVWALAAVLARLAASYARRLAENECDREPETVEVAS